jgi:hypothetical protein
MTEPSSKAIDHLMESVTANCKVGSALSTGTDWIEKPENFSARIAIGKSKRRERGVTHCHTTFLCPKREIEEM